MMLLRKIITVAIMAGAVCGWARTDDAGVSLFAPQNGKSRSAGLIINQAAVSGLRSTAETFGLDSVPLITGETANFRLEPMKVFSDNATIQVMTSSGTTETLAMPDVRTWYGRDANHPDRALFVAARADGEVRAMVTGDASTSVTVISRDKAGADDAYRIEAAILPPDDFCTTMDSGEPEITEPATGPRAVGENNIIYEIELMADLGYNMYQQLGNDNSAVLDYITDLMGAVNSIYLRDLKVRFTLSYVTIWNTQDPISKPVRDQITRESQLANYRNYIYTQRSNVHRDLAHFFDGYNLGGLAYVNVLGAYRREVRCAVSNLSMIGDIPKDGSYYFATFIAAHELGHNVGSPHTHCYNPPIDCCAVQCEGCSYVKATTGTIMSYCNQQIYNGGGAVMNFHPRVIELVRPYVERSLLLDPYNSRTRLEVRGGEGRLVPANALDTTRSTLLRSPAVGTAVEQVYNIGNVGELPLELSGSPVVSFIWPKNAADASRLISGAVPLSDPNVEYMALTGSDFSIVTQPSRTELASGTTTTFKIRYKPTTDAEKFAVVQINSNDPQMPAYRFLIKGRLIKVSSPFTGVFDGTMPIPEQGSGWTMIPVVVEDVPGSVADVQVYIGGLDCNVDSKTGIEHPWIGDLAIMLESPSGTTMSLIQYPGYIPATPPRPPTPPTEDDEGDPGDPGDPGVPAGTGGRNFCHTLLMDDPTMPTIQDVARDEAPYSGTYQAAESFAVFNGTAANGTWKFWFYDRAMPDKGVVHSISVIVRGDEAEASSAIPAVTPAENWDMYR